MLKKGIYMINRTVYTYELLLKLNMVRSAKTRRIIWGYFWVTLALGVGLVVGCVIADALASLTMYVGVFMLTVALLMFCLALANRRAKIELAVKKDLADSPNRILAYVLNQDCISVDMLSDNVQMSVRMAYSYVSAVKRMDQTSLYFVTKNNHFYVMCDEEGIDALFSFLCEKTGCTSNP